MKNFAKEILDIAENSPDAYILAVMAGVSEAYGLPTFTEPAKARTWLREFARTASPSAVRLFVVAIRAMNKTVVEQFKDVSLDQQK